ncbi:MAG: Kae1-associated serine/threonine protein kinase [Crenarchaeota archaeon]|nr:Kae1-associated serine/threonine protein kinase [Thermoproteota archaeon]
MYLTEYWGCKAVLKLRRAKSYRHPKVDLRIRKERTRNEASNMLKAYSEGLGVPALYDVDFNEFYIIMEYIDGRPLAEEPSAWAMREAGRTLASLHSINIAHWDYTTANLLVKERRVYVIDFGLSRRTEDELEKAIDAHLMIRSFLSAHPGKEGLVEEFWKGYSEVGDAERMKELVRQIELMGRYVKERRKTVW